MIGAFVLHHLAGSTLYTTVFSGSWPVQTSVLTGGSATLVGLLLLVAAMGKSAQVPLSGWMPRAMEGPTPSSAIFYGAISVHVGAYLLLRAQPLLAASPIASAAVIAVGALSAVHGSMVARTCTDAKTSLAYSSVSQLGLIFVEIGLGLSWLALLHIAGHAIVRTLQFLKAPSALHESHEIHAAAGGHLAKTGAHFEALLPAGMRLWLYRLALDRGHHDAILDRFAAGTLRRFASRMTSLEESLEKRLEQAWVAELAAPFLTICIVLPLAAAFAISRTESDSRARSFATICLGTVLVLLLEVLREVLQAGGAALAEARGLLWFADGLSAVPMALFAALALVTLLAAPRRDTNRCFLISLLTLTSSILAAYAASNLLLLLAAWIAAAMPFAYGDKGGWDRRMPGFVLIASALSLAMALILIGVSGGSYRVS
ncbi:MAG: proton-conducting transporter membrane subunit [Bryobacteraceae bacterium]